MSNYYCCTSNLILGAIARHSKQGTLGTLHTLFAEKCRSATTTLKLTNTYNSNTIATLRWDDPVVL